MCGDEVAGQQFQTEEKSAADVCKHCIIIIDNIIVWYIFDPVLLYTKMGIKR